MNNLAPLTICLIDDDSIYQMITTRIIELVHPRQQVICFSNGQLAIDYFHNSPSANAILPDIIFLDINMPVMNGWEFLEAYSALDALNKNIPVYMVSSSVNDDDAERSKKYLVVKDYIIKPMCKVRITEILKDIPLGSNSIEHTRNAHLPN